MTHFWANTILQPTYFLQVMCSGQHWVYLLIAILLITFSVPFEQSTQLVRSSWCHYGVCSKEFCTFHQRFGHDVHDSEVLVPEMGDGLRESYAVMVFVVFVLEASQPIHHHPLELCVHGHYLCGCQACNLHRRRIVTSNLELSLMMVEKDGNMPFLGLLQSTQAPERWITCP
jgi:hypothetical protein